MSAVKIALIQDNPIVGDLQGNEALIKTHWDKLDKQANLIVYSELFLCGYPPEDLVLRPDFIDACKQSLNTLIEYSKDKQAAILVGLPLCRKEKLYNAAILIHQGNILHKEYKYELPNYGVFDEQRVFDSCPETKPAKFMGIKLGIQICEDFWLPTKTKALCAQGADLLITINGSPFDVEKYNQREELAAEHVHRYKKPFIFCNQFGGQDELVFDGGSFALNKNGEKIHTLPVFEKGHHILSFDKAKKDITSSQIDTHDISREAMVYEALKTGLRDYVEKIGFPGVIIGLSGGIDSALSAAIAADALGADKVRAVMMPSPFTSSESFEDAKACAKALDISYEEIAIEEAMSAFEDTIPDLKDLAHENMQSRIRGLILMSLSNQSGAMVVTTGNKSEVGVGYSTLYGDMCGGFNVLKDIYKTDVYALSNWRNKQSAVIPERIITKAPTAELRHDQLDQDSLPPYDQLDDILAGLVDRYESLDTICARGHSRETVEKVWTLLDRAEYKRRQAAPGTKITLRAFGKDRRMPIINKFKG